MMRTLLTLASVTLGCLVFGQARIVINDDAWVRIDNGAWVVIDHGNVNGIQTLGTGGNIRSEGELNRVRWRIGTTLGTYTVPFTTAAGVKIPVTLQKTTAGAGATASIAFSTYNFGATIQFWNNFNYRPSDVTHMNNWFTGGPNNPAAQNESKYVVDRFWVMDPSFTGYAYTTKPNVTLGFTYVDNEAVLGGTANNIGPNDPVGAQRFNNVTNRWGDFLPIGTWTNPGGNVRTVTGVVVPAASYYRSWALSDAANPLPIELVDFSARCEGSVVRVEWTTATEQNNDFFTIQRSRDAQDWETIGTMNGAGTSISNITYSFVDESPLATGYYRMLQTDFDGTTTSSPTVAAGCETNGGLQIVNAWDNGENIQVVVSSSFNDVHTAVLLDAQGKVLITQPQQAISEGITTLSIPKGTLATGIYVIQLQHANGALSRRVLLN